MTKNLKGFTTFELIVGASIIILITLVSLPLLTSYKKTTALRNEARLLATNLRLTQQLAVSEQIIYSLDLKYEPDSYEIINPSSGKIIKTVQLNQAVNFSQITGLSTSTVQFTGAGAALETGTIELSNGLNQISTLEIKPSGYVQVTD